VGPVVGAIAGLAVLLLLLLILLRRGAHGASKLETFSEDVERKFRRVAVFDHLRTGRKCLALNDKELHGVYNALCLRMPDPDAVAYYRGNLHRTLKSKVDKKDPAAAAEQAVDLLQDPLIDLLVEIAIDCAALNPSLYEEPVARAGSSEALYSEIDDYNPYLNPFGNNPYGSHLYAAPEYEALYEDASMSRDYVSPSSSDPLYADPMSTTTYGRAANAKAGHGGVYELAVLPGADDTYAMACRDGPPPAYEDGIYDMAQGKGQQPEGGADDIYDMAHQVGAKATKRGAQAQDTYELADPESEDMYAMASPDDDECTYDVARPQGGRATKGQASKGMPGQMGARALAAGQKASAYDVAAPAGDDDTYALASQDRAAASGADSYELARPGETIYDDAMMLGETPQTSSTDGGNAAQGVRMRPKRGANAAEYQMATGRGAKASDYALAKDSARDSTAEPSYALAENENENGDNDDEDDYATANQTHDRTSVYDTLPGGVYDIGQTAGSNADLYALAQEEDATGETETELDYVLAINKGGPSATGIYQLADTGDAEGDYEMAAGTDEVYDDDDIYDSRTVMSEVTATDGEYLTLSDKGSRRQSTII